MSRAFWDAVTNYWSILVLLPAVLLLMAVLAAITRYWDDRSSRRR